MKKILITILMLFFLGNIFAQPNLNVFRIVGEGIDDQTLTNINNTIFAFLTENKDYKIVDCRTFSSPDAGNIPVADFYFYGKIANINEKLNLDLVLKSISSGTTRLLSNSYNNVNLILLESKSLLQKLLDQTYEIKNITSEPQTTQKATSEELAGTWTGEDDIRNIKLLQNGRGVVIFTTGLSISVDFEEKNGIVTLIQKSAITERQFPNLSRELAEEAIKKAKPIQWILTLNGDTLLGTRTESIVNLNGNKIDIKNESKNVVWTKVK